ncbi:hypothetical protein [Parageobacillus sp. G301]|uniref:hypothetical protein n=1 Tax=Parageobacillus sp. G301 TaxID=2998290 RepID=UPI0024992AE1|nr:hypothetical protein [Parageobacillus sp. G301]GLH65427.1 hypothetical protein PG301_32660 [Parageobacillus sp. G301]
MCMRKRMAALLILFLLVIFGGMQLGRFVLGQSMPMMNMPPLYGPFAIRHHILFHYGPEFEFWEFGGWIAIRMIFLLLQLILLVIGWLLWKTKGPFKWMGLAFIIWGVVSLLPKWLLIPLAFIVIYSIYKKQEPKAEPTATWPTPITHDRHFLDEWEKTIKKEEQ